MNIETVIDMGMTIGAVGIFIYIGIVFYLKSKMLVFVEDTLEGSHRYYSSTFFLAGQGVLHYATIFFSKRHAKRYKMLEKRNIVPQKIQRIFIMAFSLFMLSVSLFFIPSGIMALFNIQ